MGQSDDFKSSKAFSQKTSTSSYNGRSFKMPLLPLPQVPNFLDETHTRRLVRRISLEGPGWDSESCLELLVCANGAITRPFFCTSYSGDELNTSPGRVLFCAAQKRKGAIMDSAGVVSAQCLFFTGVYLMSSLRIFDAWRSFLPALAVCQSFNFMDPRRTAANRGECGTPAEESLPDFGSRSSLDPPQRFPSLPSTSDDEILRAWCFYLSEISLWRLETEARKDITAILNQSQHSPASNLLDRLAEISEIYHQQLVAWQSSLPPVVSISEASSSTTETDVLRFVLRGRTTYVNELITWTFLVETEYGSSGVLSLSSWETVEAAIEMLYFWPGEVEGVEESTKFLQYVMSRIGGSL
ncbi:hypothetical protein BBP40_003393 [Aspergillus hancockii]|nr:hypothetical protein BBP40_003393 [Aspergillus hancockii]